MNLIRNFLYEYGDSLCAIADEPVVKPTITLEVLGKPFRIYKDRLLREAHLSSLISKYSIRRNIRLSLVKCEFALKASSITQVVPEHCLTILENPFDRSWAHDVDVDTITLVCNRFEDFLVNNPDCLEDYFDVQQTINAELASLLEVEAFYKSRTGFDIDASLLNKKEFNQIKKLLNDETDSSSTSVNDIGSYITKDEKETEDENSETDAVILTAKAINKTLAQDFKGNSYVADLLTSGVCQIDPTFSFFTAPSYPMKILAELKRLAINRENLSNLAIAKLGADFKAANGVTNVKIIDSLPFPEATSREENDYKSLKDNLHKLDKVLDSRLYLYLMDYFNID